MASGEKLFLHFGRDGASIRSLSKNEIVASRSGAAVGGTATAGLTGRGTAAGPSEGLMKWVARKEAFSPTAFSDYGQVNIGYGTSARGRQTITEPEAWEEMRGELGKHLKAIDELNPNTPPGVRNALASLAFNTGGSWYHKGDTNPDGSLTLKGLIRAGKWAEARDRFLQYNKASGKALSGLAHRRQEKARFWDHPESIKQGTTAAQDWGGKMHPDVEKRLKETGIQGFQEGTIKVPENMLAFLHQGEAVVPARLAEHLRQLSKRYDTGGWGGGPGIPAAIRYFNPMATCPAWDRANAFGMLGQAVIEHGKHKIGIFPTPEQGAAWAMDLLSRRYAGKTVAAVQKIWSGGLRSKLPGGDFGGGMRITREMMRNPTFAIPFMK